MYDRLKWREEKKMEFEKPTCSFPSLADDLDEFTKMLLLQETSSP
jgi:hypothetical protein